MSKKSKTSHLNLHGIEIDINMVFDPKATKSFALKISDFVHRRFSVSYLVEKSKGESKRLVPFDEDHLLDMCIDSCTELLSKHPEFITAHKFSLNVKICSGSAASAATYNAGISSEPCAFIELNLDYINHLYESISAELAKQGGSSEPLLTRASPYVQQELESSIRHELRHHTERTLINETDLKKKDIFRKTGVNGTLMTWVYIQASKVRIEAVTTFESRFRSHRPTVNLRHIRMLMDSMEKVESLDISTIMRSDTSAFAYDMGVLMSFIISLDFYKKVTDDQESRRGANQIAEFIDTEMTRNKDWIDLPQIPPEYVHYTVDHLSKMSMEEFFREYEKACKRLGFSEKNILLSWTNYRKCMKRSYQAYIKKVASEGFISRLIEKPVNYFIKRLLKAA
ncbi:hypothetical protein KY363_01120 [Candidatus Woesearchaeota archaeon]|nr:hypothetical protein [Candidatus Woesearchaeota archaeon]